ncbi:MAG: hypothetical protein NTV38_12565 [Chloroflexi bacterium]|nr:hypothetical protein [Chloroflexota bacterium]
MKNRDLPAGAREGRHYGRHYDRHYGFPSLMQVNVAFALFDAAWHRNSRPVGVLTLRVRCRK